MDMVMLYPPDERINVLAPVVRGRKGEFKRELAALRARGFTRARIDGEFVALEQRHHARSPPQPHDRRARRSADRQAGHRAAAVRLDRARAEARRRHRRHQHARAAAIGCSRAGWRARSCGISIPGDDAARVLVQLAARRVPGLPGARRGATTSIRRASCPTTALSLADGAIVPWAQGRPALHRRDARRARSGRSASIRRCRSAKLPKKLRDIVLLRRAGTARPGAARQRPAERRRSRAPKDPVRRGLRGRDSRTCAAGSRRAPGPIRRRSSRTARCSRARRATASGCARRAARSA